MTRWQILRELLAAARDPERLGDVAVLKSELGGVRAREEVERALTPVRGYHPPVDLEALRQQEAGTFGREYVRFLDANGIRPITLHGSSLPGELVARNALNARYGVVHDMLHVLLGFDTSWPGEVGVWAFVGVQGWSRQFSLASWMSLLVAPLRAPLRLGDCLRAWQRGRRQGEAARLVIAERLEELLALPLAEARGLLQVNEGTDGYLPALDPAQAA